MSKGAELALAVLNFSLAIAIAPLFEGVRRKMTARIQSRQGPPILQPYFDLLKLLGKEDIESGEVPYMQRLSAYMAMASALLVALIVPFMNISAVGWAGDGILLIYLLTFCGMCTLFAGLAAGSTYSLLGISREMMLMITVEPLLAVAILAGAVHAHSLRLDAVFHGGVYSASSFPVSGVLLFFILLFSMQAFVQRTPFDISEAETELMEGPLMEYSGPKLALFKYAQMLKLVIYSSLFVLMFLPWGAGLPIAIAWLLFWAKVSLIVLFVTVVAATHARYRTDQAVRYFSIMIATGLLALVLASYGY